MKLKKVGLLLTLSTLTLSLVGCSGSSDDKKIVVGASASPHAEILEIVKDDLEEKGYELEIKVFDDYVLPNTALHEGSLDANFFQHVPYLEEVVSEKGYDITYTEKIHIEPMGLYSNSISDIGSIKENAKIAIPNDASNGSRALKLLQESGLIKVNDGELISKDDIIENKYNIEIVEMNAEQLTGVLEDVDAAVINTNYAISADLNPTEDAIVIESSESPYANILACRGDNKDSEKITVLSEVLTSDEVKDFINDEYKGSIVPAF